MFACDAERLITLRFGSPKRLEDIRRSTPLWRQQYPSASSSNNNNTALDNPAEACRRAGIKTPNVLMLGQMGLVLSRYGITRALRWVNDKPRIFACRSPEAITTGQFGQ